jgi:hypothetical protein
VNLSDCDRTRAIPFKDLARSAYVFTDERHQFLSLTWIGHLVGDRQVDVTSFGQDDERRAAPGACQRTLQVEVGGR